jgi:hypothetical protein
VCMRLEQGVSMSLPHMDEKNSPRIIRLPP